ncbi:serine/threonine-protein kinase [Sandaracinus amylolyticus]|uniref:serine/threonine-protein kinase n=1 Tax=Sandaracinus amylolyticus TaxID=927083 RepID=UPI001F268A5A|nr:serine/threonine-protein kinase [Sandaracinus amylolyticus]UJR79567.1 Putative serine/threonine-protein kinase pknL [Sandaracinus amylolyticus]
MEPTQTTQPIPDRIAHFRVREKLGEDAFGVIYLGDDENDRERGPVRIRVLPESVHLEPDRRARLIRDAERSMAIDHPGLAALYDVGDDPRGLYLVSAPVKGRTLRAYVEDRKQLDLAETLRIAQEMTSALGAVHREGLVHGVLSDERVIVDDAGRVHVIDLGLAELVRPVVSAEPSAVMPDENRRVLDARTDVYAIAAMIYEALTGTRVSTNELSSDPPEQLPRIEGATKERIPAALVTLLQRATSRDRAERPEDADRFQAALASIDLPTEPLGEQIAETRKDVLKGTSNAWVVGASIAIALVLTFVLVLVIGGT